MAGEKSKCKNKRNTVNTCGNSGSKQKFVGETALWMPKSGSPHTPSEKAIKELIDTDLPFPMPYGGKRKGLIAIPTNKILH